MLDKIRKKIADNNIVVGANILFSDADVSELFGFAGCDYVWIDMEHAPLTHKDVEQHIIAANAGGSASFVRIPWNDQVMAKRIIDMGPDGIIFPFIRTVEDAKAAMASCTYPPHGIRGWNPIRALKYGCMDQDWFVEHVDSLFWKILMIEHIDAVKNLEEILNIPGVDAIIIGPSDLSGSMGKMLVTDTDEFWEVIGHITDVAKKAGVVIGTAVPTNCPKEKIFKWMSYGVQMISIGQDAFMLSSIVRDNVKATRDAYLAYNK